MFKYVAQAVINVPLSRSPCDFSDPSHVSGRSAAKDNESLKKRKGRRSKTEEQEKGSVLFLRRIEQLRYDNSI